MTTLSTYMAGTEHEPVTLASNGERSIEYQDCDGCCASQSAHIVAWSPARPGCGYSTTVMFKVCLDCGHADLPREHIRGA